MKTQNWLYPAAVGSFDKLTWFRRIYDTSVDLLVEALLEMLRSGEVVASEAPDGTILYRLQDP